MRRRDFIAGIGTAARSLAAGVHQSATASARFVHGVAIEQLFAKLKHLVRKAEPRTIEDTWRKVGPILDFFSPAECANYLKNSGYASV
jgi:hypothetical protein